MSEKMQFEDHIGGEENDAVFVETLPSAPSERSVKKTFSTLGFGLAVYAAVSLVVALIIQLVAMAINNDVAENAVFLNIVSPVALYLFALPCLLGVLALFGVKGEAISKRKVGPGALILIFVISFGFMYIGSFTGQGVMWCLSEVVGYNYSNALVSMIDYKYMWVTFICMCIVAPIGEELVFRKLIIDRTHKYGGFVSIFFSGLIFGLMHANFYQFFYAFALGLILGYLYYTSGNVWYCIGIHAGVNFVGSILTSYLDLGATNMNEALETVDFNNLDAMLSFYGEYWFVMVALLVFFAFVVISMLSAIVLPIVLRKRIALERGEPALPRKRAFSLAFLNVGAVVMIAVYVFEFVLNLLPTRVG